MMIMITSPDDPMIITRSLSVSMITVTSPDHLIIAVGSLKHAMVRIKSADHPMIALIIFKSHDQPIILLDLESRSSNNKISYKYLRWFKKIKVKLRKTKLP